MTDDPRALVADGPAVAGPTSPMVANPRTGKLDEPDVVTSGLNEEPDDERPTPSRVE